MQSSTVPESTVNDFRDFVEWILDVDLSPSHEEEIRSILTEEWAENDRETMSLVEANVATYRAITALDEQTRQAWRKQNQPVFVASLEKHATSELGTSLLAAYRRAHPAPAQSGTAEELSWGQIAMGVLGLAGAVALAVMENRQQAKHELNEVVKRDRGEGIAGDIGSIMDARNREVEELRKVNPTEAAAKAIEYQRMNQELVNSWINTSRNISTAINSNISGSGWSW